MVKSVIKRSSGSFLEQEKHVIIQDFLKSGKSKNEIWREYTGRADHGRLLQWMRDLGYLSSSQQLMPKLASNGFNMAKKKVEPKSSEEEFEQLQLKNRIVELEKQLKEAELKAIAFSTMVDIAEKEFKIPIRKKFNTKP
jgi:transposase